VLVDAGDQLVLIHVTDIHSTVIVIVHVNFHLDQRWWPSVSLKKYFFSRIYCVPNTAGCAVGVGPPFRRAAIPRAAIFSHFQQWQLTVRDTVRVRVTVSRLVVAISRTGYSLRRPRRLWEWQLLRVVALRNGGPKPCSFCALAELVLYIYMHAQQARHY